MSTITERTIQVSPLTRVEGAGGVRVRIEEGRVVEVKLDIQEPPRFFEAFLRGRHFSEAPDLTSRVCGICPVAYQLTSVLAIESALGLTVPEPITRMRRFLYLAEWLESHALHVYLLHLPDFLGFDSAISLSAAHPEVVARGLRLKRTGTAVLQLIGGRASHPVSVCVGGFSRLPTRERLETLRPELEWALGAAKETVGMVQQLDFPPIELDYEFVSLRGEFEYPVIEGTVASSDGSQWPTSEFERHFLEEQLPHSTALHSVRADDKASYLVGPLARMALNFDHLTPQARASACASGIHWPSRNPFHGIVARAVEMVFACEEMLAILDRWEDQGTARLAVRPAASRGCAATEAPRGILYHSYRLDAAGVIGEAKIVPPTAQNLRRIEDDLRLVLPQRLDSSDAELASLSERIVRAYDPCISCSTHALTVTIERKP